VKILRQTYKESYEVSKIGPLDYPVYTARPTTLAQFGRACRKAKCSEWEIHDNGAHSAWIG